MATGQYLNPSRLSKKPLGIKANKKHHVITHNPSTANPGETLYVRIPKLTTDTFYVPGSIYLSADVKISGDTGHDNHLVQNFGRNVISRMSVKWGSQIAYDLNNYDLYMTYKDLWLPEEIRNDMTFEGIQDKNVNKLRSGLTVSGANAGEKILHEVYGNKYKIPLDFELLTNHAPLYKYALDENIIFELELNPNKKVLNSTKIKDWSYQLTNICLEYDTVTDAGIASTITQQYNSGYAFMYDKVEHFVSARIPANDTYIREHINIPARSVKGILLLFTKAFEVGQRDSEQFCNPEIKDVEITIDGIAYQLYANGLRMLDQWPEAKKFFMNQNIKNGLPCHMNIKKYYYGKGYGLWIDCRTTEDNHLHGSGLKLQNTKDGIQLHLKKKAGEGPYTMQVFVVLDAQINISDCQLQSVMF